jgi:predicted glycoside hydrolase/deacetylase ChbG (UPF0249 family)
MNPALKKLGFDKRDRVALIHADDVGVSQASIEAYLELVEFGLVTTGSAMPPCPWFPEVARHARASAGGATLDLGLHLPITCEYESYRWRPLSHAAPDSGLIDEHGYFHQNPMRTGSEATVESVLAEVEAQIALSKSLGLQPTHLDNHHGVLMFNARFLEPYVDLALRRGLLPVIAKVKPLELVRSLGRAAPSRDRRDQQPHPQTKIDLKALASGLHALAKKAGELEERGVPVVDHMGGMPTRAVEDRLGVAKKLMSDLKPGLTHFVLHPVVDTPEARAMTPTWPYRAGDYETFMSDELKQHIRNQGIQLIGYRALAELLPN